MATHISNFVPDSEDLELLLDGNVNNIDGSTWKGANFDVVMQNGPTYTQLNTVGYWTFNGSNQFGYIKEANYGVSPTGSDHGVFYELTCHVWANTTYNSTASWSNNWAWIDFDRSEVFNMFATGTGQIGFAGKDGYNDYFDRFTSVTMNDGNWHLCTCVYSSYTKSLKSYLDGSLVQTWTFSNAGYLGNRSRRWGFIGDGSEAGSENGGRNGIYYDGNIGRIVLLKSAHTDAQVADEWRKHKGRFGL